MTSPLPEYLRGSFPEMVNAIDFLLTVPVGGASSGGQVQIDPLGYPFVTLVDPIDLTSGGVQLDGNGNPFSDADGSVA
jgi:hypothetical protein